MARRRELTECTGLTIYFADPHSPWQRGIMENTNGLLREYLPKGANLALYSQPELGHIACSLNTRPRKTLGFHAGGGVLCALRTRNALHSDPLLRSVLETAVTFFSLDKRKVTCRGFASHKYIYYYIDHSRRQALD